MFNKQVPLWLSLGRIDLWRVDSLGETTEIALVVAESSNYDIPATVCGPQNSKYPASFQTTTDQSNLMLRIGESGHLRVAAKVSS